MKKLCIRRQYINHYREYLIPFLDYEFEIVTRTDWKKRRFKYSVGACVTTAECRDYLCMKIKQQNRDYVMFSTAFTI